MIKAKLFELYLILTLYPHDFDDIGWLTVHLPDRDVRIMPFYYELFGKEIEVEKRNNNIYYIQTLELPLEFFAEYPVGSIK